MAFCWRVDDGPTWNAGLVALWFFRGSRPVLHGPNIFVFFFRLTYLSSRSNNRLFNLGSVVSLDCSCIASWILKKLIFLVLYVLLDSFFLLSCQPRVTVTSCFVYNVQVLIINRSLVINTQVIYRFVLAQMECTCIMFNLTIVNKSTASTA